MTRKKALDKAYQYSAQCINVACVQSIIHSIYHDFENRTCSNCKYYTACDDNYNYCYKNTMLNGFVESDFGCNKWESK